VVGESPRHLAANRLRKIGEQEHGNRVEQQTIMDTV
jgi:hypothetical protein